MQFMVSVNIARVMAYRGKGSRPGDGVIRVILSAKSAWPLHPMNGHI